MFSIMLKILLFCVYLNNVSALTSLKNWENAADCVGDELNGTCVEPHRCLSTNPYILGLKYPLECTLTGGKEGVCCTDCELVTNSSDYFLDMKNKRLLQNDGQESWDKCLEFSQTNCYLNRNSSNTAERYSYQGKCHLYTFGEVGRTVGGQDSTRGKYSHIALLGYEGTTTPLEWVCSGSLISERFILTAAHCLETRQLGPVTQAAFGLLKRSDPAENWHKYNIKRAVPHPNYEPPSAYDDIALLETEIPVVFITRLILPACLQAISKGVLYEDRGITAIGWGRLGFSNELADTLQEVYLQKFSYEECSEKYPVDHLRLSAGINRATQMCYGHKTLIRDTCQGDSGGPLQIYAQNIRMHIVIGVTSYGGACGFKGGAGVYTKVAEYVPWIGTVVWPDLNKDKKSKI